ncbi:hypothetical protein F1643_09925 [Azospirillum sp. INR13]|uniref:hypothetical protein n=1 Tax=Azospirillum sp. INR13 TaxID=2596919 RepID=UPI0018925614|nr:hypothetical protein [Azospirillum sp. INR13]MBF5094750.1 hypothetical protein [Azospirillum sp. INR13]
MAILSTLADMAEGATAKAKATYQTLRTGGRMAADSVKAGLKESGEAVLEGDFGGAAKRGAKAAGQTLTDDLADHFRRNAPVPAKNPTIPCSQAEIDAKAKRVAERQALIEEAREKKVLPEVTERFARDNKAVERARLAADVYHHENGPDSPKTPPPGWTRLSDDPAELRKYGLVPSDLNPAPPRASGRSCMWRTPRCSGRRRRSFWCRREPPSPPRRIGSTTCSRASACAPTITSGRSRRRRR